MYAILFTDCSMKTFETKEEMQKFMSNTKNENIVMTGEEKYIKILARK